MHCMLRRYQSLLIALLLALHVVAVVPELASAENGRMFDPRFREGAPSDALSKGPPPLSRGHLNAFVDLFEAAFDLALPAPTEQALRDALETTYEEGDAAWREGLFELTDPIVNLRCCARCGNRAGVRGCLRAFRRSIDQRLRKNPKEPANRILLQVLERRHEVVWVGDPEVKRLAADAYVEMVTFVTSLGRNETVKLTSGQQSALRDYLGRDLRRLPKATRGKLERVHRTWLLAKARWDRGRDTRRFRMRREATLLLARLAPVEGGLSVDPGSDLRTYARAASKVAATERAFDAATAVARNPKALLETLTRGLALDQGVPTFTFMYR
jgi:hypothetical protein